MLRHRARRAASHASFRGPCCTQGSPPVGTLVLSATQEHPGKSSLTALALRALRAEQHPQRGVKTIRFPAACLRGRSSPLSRQIFPSERTVAPSLEIDAQPHTEDPSPALGPSVAPAGPSGRGCELPAAGHFPGAGGRYTFGL